MAKGKVSRGKFLGEAAGTAAALAVNSRCSVGDLDTGFLRARLTEHGAIII
jgi:hypothetical protein